jgi:hypothetical protein
MDGRIDDVFAPREYAGREIEIVMYPVEKYSEEYYCKDFENAIKELQRDSVANGTSEMTMEEIDAEIALCRKERAERKALQNT